MRVLAAGAESAILAGDPNQAVFGFRGANANLLLVGAAGAETITLDHSHRCAPAVARAISGMAARLPAPGGARWPAPAGEDGEDDGR